MDKHCDLCDLPFSQCAHGLEQRQCRAAKKARRKQAAKNKKRQPAPKPPKERPLSTAERAKLPSVLQGVPVVQVTPQVKKSKRAGCVVCGKARFSRYNVCAKCLRNQGGKECTRCGRLFRPKPGTKGKRCGTCSGRRAYVTNTLGAPSLGKRR